MTLQLTALPVVQAITDAASAVMVGSLADVVVLGAADMAQVYEKASLTIGQTWNPETGEVSASDAIDVETMEAGLGRSVVETTRVACVAYSGSGDIDLPTHQAKVNAILTAFRDALRALTDVGAASANAQITGQQWAQIIDDTQGSGVLVAFDVVVAVLP